MAHFKIEGVEHATYPAVVWSLRPTVVAVAAIAIDVIGLVIPAGYVVPRMLAAHWGGS